MGTTPEKVFCIPPNLRIKMRNTKAVEDTIERAGKIDCLIHNAGTNDGGAWTARPPPFSNLSENLLRLFSDSPPWMNWSKTESRHQCRIQVAETGQSPEPQPHKGAMNGLTREWALDLADRGVRVNAVIPPKSTPMYRRWIPCPIPMRPLPPSRKTFLLANRYDHGPGNCRCSGLPYSSVQSHHGQIFHPDGGYLHLDRSYARSGSTRGG